MLAASPHHIAFSVGATVTLAHVPGAPVMTVRHRREFARKSWYDVTWLDAHGHHRDGTFAEDDLKPAEKAHSGYHA